MKLKIPSAGTPIYTKDLFRGVIHAFFGDGTKSFEKWFSEYFTAKYCHVVNSGTTACYSLFMAIKELPEAEGRNEVIFPAYTAPSLILPIKKAGLIPRVVDISLTDFNMDTEKALDAVSQKTLAVMPVHMFGIPMKVSSMFELLRNKGVFVIENAASSFGSKIDGELTGLFADAGFISFNRGKNITTLTGGCIATGRDDIEEKLIPFLESLPSRPLMDRILLAGKFSGLSLAVRPFFYTVLYSIISRYKYTTLHTDFDIFHMTDFQAGAGMSIFRRIEDVLRRRKENGLYLINALKGINGLRLPLIPKDAETVFNQFPVVVEDTDMRDRLVSELLKTGLEVTTLYEDPIHRIYPEVVEPGEDDPCPNASYISKRLLLIPTHPGIDHRILKGVVDIIKRNMEKT